MCSVQEMQQVDRELSLELIESPINPALLNMVSPLTGGYDPLFYLWINGEALWQWRSLHSLDQVFSNLQDSLVRIGYNLSSSSRPRVGMAVYRRVQYLANKARNIKNSDTRRAMRSQYWCEVALHPDEISQGPDEIIHQLVESCAKTMDGKWDVTRTPGVAQGAELPFKVLLEREIREHLKNSNDTIIRVKISGDGAKMSHTSSLFVCSFSLLEDGQCCLSSAGNHTIAVVKCKEEYETLKSSLSNVTSDVNSLIDDPHMIVDGKKIKLEFYLGGDYKFLLIAMGMKGATSNNSCIWCTIHKDERCNMSHSCATFQTPELVRKVDGSWSKQPGCHSQPFFLIPLENVVLDELHLMLRITDRLEEGLIFDVLQWDEDDNSTRSGRQREEVHLQDFLAAVRSLGVSFSLYKTGDKWDWTSLLGGEKKILLKKLPDLFEKFLPSERVDKTKQLWVNFRKILDTLNSESLTDNDMTAFEAMVLSWGKQMVGMSGSGRGYIHTRIITPYMHNLIYHVPVMLRRHGSLRRFSGQGVEKKNDDLRRYFHRKINRWDAAKNLLLVEKRQEELKDTERIKRSYEKRKTSFWIDGGKQDAAKKVQRVSTSTPVPSATAAPAPQPNFNEANLRKKNVNELISLLEKTTGKTLNKRTRKQEIINALMSTLPRSE